MRKYSKYNKTLLDDIAKRDKGIIIGEYSKFNKKDTINFKCNCGNNYTKKLYSIVEHSGLFCRICTNKHKKEKTLETNNIKYKSAYYIQNNDIKEQIKARLIEKYNVTNISQLESVKDKKKKTSRKKYNTDYPLQHKSVKEKREQTNLIRYNVKNQFQDENIKQKIKETNIKKYNVEHAAQNPDIFEKIQKNSKKYKEYLMPSGIVKKVQGYEPFALDILIQQYTEEQIKTDRKDIPRIKYIINEKDKYYFPDIYIPHENKIIEVKSTWTYKCKTDNITLKKDACIEQGYNYEIWCFNSKGEKIDIDSINEGKKLRVRTE